MKNENGVTLVELTIAAAVVGVMIVLIMSFLTDKIVDSALKNARSNMLHQTQLTLDIINRDIKHAANVDDANRWADTYAPDAPGDEYSWRSDADTLILASPALDNNNNIIYEDPSAYISYKNDLIFFVKDGVLYKRILAAGISGNSATTTCPSGTTGCPSDIKLADNVTSFAIAYYDSNDDPVPSSSARSVSVTLSTQKIVYGKSVSATYTVRSVFRNE